MMDIADFTAERLALFYPFPNASDHALIRDLHPEAVERYLNCASKIRIFRGNSLPDPYHIMKYPIYLYCLMRTAFEKNIDDSTRFKDRLHALSKALHGCSVYFKTQLPEVFFFNYATGMVLGSAHYGNRFVAYHGVSVTANNGVFPQLGNEVLLMPHVLISGACRIGNNVTVSAGVKIIDQDVPDDCLVFQGANGKLILKTPPKKYISDYLL